MVVVFQSIEFRGSQTPPNVQLFYVFGAIWFYVQKDILCMYCSLYAEYRCIIWSAVSGAQLIVVQCVAMYIDFGQVVLTRVGVGVGAWLPQNTG